MISLLFITRKGQIIKATFGFAVMLHEAPVADDNDNPIAAIFNNGIVSYSWPWSTLKLIYPKKMFDEFLLIT